jgi:hypothetical protein
MGHAVAQLVGVLHYKPEGRGFDSRCRNFYLTQSLRSHCVPGVDSASNKNEYQEYFLGDKSGRCIGLTTLSLSYADCLEILGASVSWHSQGLSRSVMGLLLHTSYEALHHVVFSIILSLAVLDPRVILSSLFSDAFNLCSSPEVR